MDNKKNHNLYKREYKKTLKPTILNAQENGSLLNKMDTQNQIAHLNNLNDLYLNTNQQLNSIPEENYYYPINHENNFNRIVNLSYDKKICQICQVYNMPVQRSNSGLTVQKMQKYDTTKVFAEKIQLITPLPKTQPTKVSVTHQANHTNIQAIEYVSKNRKNTSKPTSVSNKSVPTKKTSSHLPSNYSPEIPKLPSKKTSPSKEHHMRPILMSSPKADISRKIQQQNLTENDHFNQDFSNGIQVENTNSSSLYSVNTNKTIPPAPPMDNSLLSSFKNTNVEKQPQVPFDSVMDELRYKLQKRKIKCDEVAPKSTPNEKKQAKAETPFQVELEIDHLLNRIKDYKFENVENTTTMMKCQEVVVSKSPTTSSDLALKNVLNKIKIPDVPKHSEKCVIKTTNKVPSPEPLKSTPPPPKANGVKRNTVLAMAKYFEENFKPKEVKIVRKKPKIIPVKNLKTTSPIESGKCTLPSNEKLIKPKEKSKMVADKTEERISHIIRPKSMCEKSLLNENFDYDYDNEKSEISEVRPVFLNELPNHSRQSLEREKSVKYRNRSQSSTNYNRIHDVNSKFRPLAYLRNPAEFTTPIYSEEARDYYNKGIYKLDFKKELPALDRNTNKVDFLPRVEYLNDFSNYLQKKPVNGMFFI
jgi:hypothetical protein